MPKVKLKRNWFGPDGVLYETRNNPVEIPKAIMKHLPKDAEKGEAEAEPVGDQTKLNL